MAGYLNKFYRLTIKINLPFKYVKKSTSITPVTPFHIPCSIKFIEKEKNNG